MLQSTISNQRHKLLRIRWGFYNKTWIEIIHKIQQFMFGILIKSKIIFCSYIEVDFILEYVCSVRPLLDFLKQNEKICERLWKDYRKTLVDVYLTCMKYEWSCWEFLSIFLLNRNEFYFTLLCIEFCRKTSTQFVILNVIHWTDFTASIIYRKYNSFNNYTRTDFQIFYIFSDANGGWQIKKVSVLFRL